MPTLDWIGKDAVIRHHKEVPFRLLEPDAGLSQGDGCDGNLIVQGDNLHALKALLPKYAGRVKCIYIDPPYNTGNEGGDNKGWTYSDNVNSPVIQKWLGDTVQKEGEDLTRHDKWLCMMYPRMVLLKAFLAKDSSIFISIDDIELAPLRLLLDEIFGRHNFLATFVWKSRRNLDSRHNLNVSVDHEYVLAYSFGDFRLKGAQKDKTKYSNPDKDPRGPWMSDNLVGLATKDRRPNLHYDLIDPKTRINYGCPRKGWRYSKETMAEKIRDGRILWPKSPSGRPRHKKFMDELLSLTTGFSSLLDCGNTNEGGEVLQSIFGDDPFMFPKPPSLVREIINQSTDKDSIILDSFAGSGTTGHAVLKQNAEDGGTRKFILVEMEEKIARDITAERIRRVSAGYTGANGKAVEGLGGGFQFCRLSDEPLFNEFGDIREDVTFAQLADFVWFSETGLGYTGDGTSPLLGVHEGRGIYLLFNGILGDRRPQGGNILTRLVLDGLPAHGGPKVIYAAASRLGSSAMQREQIVFKQTPYAIEV